MVRPYRTKLVLTASLGDSLSVIWQCKGCEFDLSEKGLIMGILNVTPDSFSDGGSYTSEKLAVERALEMEKDGADIIDIGGESTRPGAEVVPVEEELERTVPLIQALRKYSDIAISIDTSKARVAKEALNAGANIVNDITGLEGDSEMLEVCRSERCGVVIMHMQGRPETMQESPCYEDVVKELQDYFAQRYAELTAGGLEPKTLCFDPGIGFGKSSEHNLSILKNVGLLRSHGRPLLLGVSRKSTIARALGEDSLSVRDWPTSALTAFTRKLGVEIHRVHQVKENKQALQMSEAIMEAIVE